MYLTLAKMASPNYVEKDGLNTFGVHVRGTVQYVCIVNAFRIMYMTACNVFSRSRFACLVGSVCICRACMRDACGIQSVDYCVV